MFCTWVQQSKCSNLTRFSMLCPSLLHLERVCKISNSDQNIDSKYMLQAKKIAYERKILNWEKLYCKITSVQGHGRRWKYTIEQLKERTTQG